MSKELQPGAILFLVVDGERPVAVFDDLHDAQAFAYQLGVTDGGDLRSSVARVEEVPFLAPETSPPGPEPKKTSLWASPELRRQFGALGNIRTIDD